MSETESDLSETTHIKFGEFVVTGWLAIALLFISVIVIASIVYSVGQGILALTNDNVTQASGYAGFVSGLATLALVILTGWYAHETRRMVNETEEARREEREREEHRRDRELNKLRKALLSEIQSVEGLDKLANEYSPGWSVHHQVVPMEIYKSNAGDVGQLSTSEVESIVEFYTIAQIVEDHFELQRRYDLHYGSLFERIYAALSFEWLLFRKQRKARTKRTTYWLNELADVQDEAVDQITEELDSEFNDEPAQE